jgi:hypothetical protein
MFLGVERGAGIEVMGSAISLAVISKYTQSALTFPFATMRVF